MRVGNGMPATKIMDIFGTSNMTHSGHIFAPLELPVRSKDKGMAKTR